MSSKVVTSAVVIQPPADQWAGIQSIRKQHDKAYSRWMPHINLIYPFVAECEVPGLLPLLTSALTKIDPFTLTLADFEHFSHGKMNTIYLNPKPSRAGVLCELQKAIENVVPFCNDQSTKSETGFIPHLTVGQATETMKDLYKTNWKKKFSPVIWTVSEVYIICRKGDEPFQVKYMIPMGYQTIVALPAPVVTTTVQNGLEDGTPSDLTRVTERVESWLREMNPEKRPKAAEKLEKSMKPLCICQVTVMTVDEAFDYLIAEGYISPQSNGEVKYTTPSKYPNTAEEIRARHNSTVKDNTLARLKDWVYAFTLSNAYSNRAKDKNVPKTVDKLKNSLYHLTVTKISVPPADVFDNLVNKGLLFVHPSTNASSWDTEGILCYNF